MPAPTLFRRLVIAQCLGSFVLVGVFGAAFYVERNRTIARLTGQRWAPALRDAAGLGTAQAASSRVPDARAVRVLPELPPGAIRAGAWSPRLSTLRETLRDAGVPAGDIAFSRTSERPLTWIAVASPDGRERWLGIDDDIVETHVFRRLFLALALGFLIVSTASWLVARRLTRPLEALRRRMEAHDAPGVVPPPVDASAHDVTPAVDPAATLEIDAIDAAWRSLTTRLDHQESERTLLLAGVSHDLRSPLARIRVAAELLPETDGVATRRGAIVRNVEVADRLIDSFLDYVRASELPLDAQVDVAALARRLRSTRDEPEELLTVVAPARLDMPATNALLLERLIGNLVDNAFRHGKPPVRVRIEAVGGCVVIAVEDHGAGIAIAEQPRMTRAFARGDESRGTPGAGLGLAVVQQIVRRMKGTLSFDSADDVQCVRARLPMH